MRPFEAAAGHCLGRQPGRHRLTNEVLAPVGDHHVAEVRVDHHGHRLILFMDRFGPQSATISAFMDTSRRVLQLLVMFTTRPSWRADELAERLEVTDRTLRRDVTRLRQLGYPIVSTTGRYGGYELGAGGRLPPLLLDDEEAVAVALSLRAMTQGADASLGEAALSAATKLRQVLPDRLRHRVEAVDDVAVAVTRAAPPRDDAPPVNIGLLTDVAIAARRAERIQFRYRDGADRITDRRVEPHRLVSLGRRWYLVGFDLDRDDWRTYRVDRVDQFVATGHRATPRTLPDAAAQVAEGVAVRAFEHHARIRLFAVRTEAARSIAPNVGVLADDDAPPIDNVGQTCIVTIGGDLDWIARYLIGLPMKFTVLEPPELRIELRSLARRVLRDTPR